jgi:hypothetical protein
VAGVRALEDRSLLAIAAFTVNLYEDAGSGPGQSISDDMVQAGDRFYMEILAREYDPLIAGLRGVALDIAWDPTVFQEIDTAFDPGDPTSPLVTPDFPLFRSGELDNSAGTIEDLGGSAFLSSGDGRAIGNATSERFSLLHFQAIQVAEESQFSIRQGLSSIVTVPVLGLESADLYFEQPTITVLPGGELRIVDELIPSDIGQLTLFVGPLTAEDYFKSTFVESIAHGEEFAEQTIGEHECWSNEPLQRPLVDALAGNHRSVGPWSSQAPVLPGFVSDSDLNDATPTSSSSPAVGPKPSAQAIDSLLETNEAVSLLDEIEKQIDQLVDGRYYFPL